MKLNCTYKKFISNPPKGYTGKVMIRYTAGGGYVKYHEPYELGPCAFVNFSDGDTAIVEIDQIYIKDQIGRR